MGREAQVERAVRVELRYTDPDDRITIEFLEWQMAAGVFPIRGTGASSPPLRLAGETRLRPGWWQGFFTADDYPKVYGWLCSKGLLQPNG